MYRRTQRGLKLHRLLAFLLIVSILISMGSGAVYGAGQASRLGTRASNGSPLVSDSFTNNNWDSWEMLCFGVFISNFCDPFTDDYSTAFSDSATSGSKGKGLKALQFSTGGDSEADNYLRDMLSYCITAQGTDVRPITVDYSMYDYGEKQADIVLGSRQAYLDDLIPAIRKYDDSDGGLTIVPATAIKYPYMYYQTVAMKSQSNFLKEHGVSLNSTGTNLVLLREAVLPEFKVSNSANTVNLSGEQGGGSNTIFDLADSYDSQVLTALLGKVFNKSTASSTVDSTDENEATTSALDEYLGQKYKLYMDAFGNICIQKDSRYIVIIPASANSHITKERSYNLVNSLLLNNFVLSENQTRVVSGAVGSGTATDEWSLGGSVPIGKESRGISKGKMIAYASTDSMIISEAYKSARKNTTNSGTRDTTLGDGETEKTVPSKYADMTEFGLIADDGTVNYSAGQGLYRLLSDNVLYNEPLQLSITGLSAQFDEKKKVFLWFKKDRDPEDRNIGVTISALSILSNMGSSSLAEDKVLDNIIQYDSSSNYSTSLQPLFDNSGSYYLLPSTVIDTSMKLYFNHACQILTKSKKVNSQGLSFNADNMLNLIQGSDANDSVDLSIRLLFDESVGVGVHSLQAFNGSTGLGDGIYTSETLPSPMLKDFLNQYYDLDTSGQFGTVDGATSMAQLYNAVLEPKKGYSAYFDGDKDDADLKNMPDDIYTNYGFLSNIRVYKPAQYFSIASQVFGVDEGVQFYLYTPQIYMTYLDFYGFLDSDTTTNKFNKTLFSGSSFLSFSADNFEYTKSAEEQEAETKANVYKLLSLDSAGDKYREAWFKGVIKAVFVKPFDKSLETENSIIGDKTKLLSVETAKNNAITGAILSNWGSIERTLFIFLACVAVLSGLFKRRSVIWHFSTLLVIAMSLMLNPILIDISPTLCNKYINYAYKKASTYWTLAESIKSDQQEVQVNNLQSDDSRVKALLTQLNFLDTDSTLMVKLDISRKVIDNLSIENAGETIQRNRTLRWLLPSMMKEISASNGSYDYVSIPVTQLYNNFASVYLKYKETDYKPTTYKNSYASDRQSGLSLGDKQATRFEGYGSTGTDVTDATMTYKSITRLRDESDLVHTQFYLMNDLFVATPYSEEHGGKAQMSIRDWFKMSEDVKKYYASDSDTSRLKSFWKDTLSTELNTFNRYDYDIPQHFGYLYTTEGLGTYFYTVAKDTFNEGGSAKTPANILLNMQGNVVENEEGEEVRQTFMHQGSTGYLRDYLDLEEVFTNVIPYLYQLQTLACGDGETKGLLGNTKMTGNSFYSSNHASWVFRSNWVTKIYEDSMYGASGKVSYVVNGEAKTEQIRNISDPRCYPADRPMVFSEAQMHAQGLTEKQLTVTELKCIALGADVEKKWTTLINYSSLDNLSTESLYRIMAMEAWIGFNQRFTHDNMFASSKTLYPTSYDLRDISFITLFRGMLTQMTGNGNFMNVNEIGSALYDTFGLWAVWLIQFLVFCLRQLFPLARELFLMMQLILYVITVLLNTAESKAKRLMAMAGWFITTLLFTGITIFYYFVLSWASYNPTSDTLITTNKLFSNFGSGLGLLGWGLLIIVLTLLYILFVLFFNYALIRGKFGLSLKDGGFGFYQTVAQNAVSGLTNSVKKAFNRSQAGGMQNTFEQTEKPVKTVIVNTEREPAHMVVDDGEVYSFKKGIKKQKHDDSKSDSGTWQESEEVNTVNRENIKDSIGEEIEKGQKLDESNS